MAKFDNYALYLLEMSRDNISGSIAQEEEKNIELQKRLEVSTNHLEGYHKQLAQILEAIKQLTGDKDVKTTSKSKKTK